jgi:predicted nucleotidyltransferase/GNAT superfamily N-acetyltransferase
MNELSYREKLLSDPDTMSYNKGYALSFHGYNKETGCITFPGCDWQAWFDHFIGKEPECYYAYIVRAEDDAFIGEVDLHKSNDSDWHEMGIVLEAKYRGRGYADEALKLLLKQAFESIGVKAVYNKFEDVREAAVKMHLSAGFTEYKKESGMVELLITKEKYYRLKSVDKIVTSIINILSDCHPSIYLYGSMVLDDFKLGWSDIDILCLTETQISQAQADELVGLRQKLLQIEPDNIYYRSFEGGMLTISSFLGHTPDRVVYWGTSGQRITDNYCFDSFSMTELLENGILLYGDDVRSRMSMPTYEDLYLDIKRHYETIRRYARTTDRKNTSCGWLLDISRCIYTLRTGKIIAKTTSAEWALENKLCPDEVTLEKALEVRKNPLKYEKDEHISDYLETLGDKIQSYADVFEAELNMKNLK